MKTSTLLAVALTVTLALPAAAQDIRVRSARVGGPDVATVEKMGKFYQTVFGLTEISRETRPTDPTFLEIIMNFGATKEAAAQARTPKVVVITAPKGTPFPPPVSNLVFEVADAAGIAAKVPAAGGVVSSAPKASTSPTSTSVAVGFVNDPAGNRIEIIQPKK
jgi:predicted enzyme related to lactoylglutathione lyase